MSETIEELASQYGWKPEGEKSAEEYVKVALEKFPDQSKKIKQLFTALDEMKTHLSKSEQVAYERAKKELEQQRKEAIREGNVEKAEELYQAQAELQPATFQTEIHPAITEFEEKNKDWLNGTSYEELKMQDWVERQGALLGKKKLPPEEHMRILDEHVRKEFSSYFASGDDVSPVSSSRENVKVSNAGKKKNYTFSDLNETQKKTAKLFEQMGTMTIENYIKDLVKHGDLQ